MKKFIGFLIVAVMCLSSAFSLDQKTKDDLKDAGKNAKEALKSTGKFFAGAGKEIGSKVKEEFDDIKAFKAFGTWVHEGKKAKTIITFNEDGTMEVVQKSGAETDIYSGTYTYNLNFVNFKIKEQSHKDWIVVNNGDRETSDSSWFLYVSVEDAEHIKVSCSDMPDEKEGVSFSKGVVFKKK